MPKRTSGQKYAKDVNEAKFVAAYLECGNATDAYITAAAVVVFPDPYGPISRETFASLNKNALATGPGGWKSILIWPLIQKSPFVSLHHVQ